jgi:hypothetical protein
MIELVARTDVAEGAVALLPPPAAAMVVDHRDRLHVRRQGAERERRLRVEQDHRVVRT